MDVDHERLSHLIGSEVLAVEPVGGGCIARCAKVMTRDGPRFVKTGRGEVAASLEAEADGLRTLRAATDDGGLLIPSVRAFGSGGRDEPAVLVIDWIEDGAWTDAAWEHLGRGLAQLHGVTADGYGHHRDNFIGRLPQRNERSDDWIAFYRDCRLAPQVEIARTGGRWRREWDRPYDRLRDALPDLLPPRPPPSLVHGDLWSGNILASDTGRAALIDPAVHAGHRETDLAMARLFGGFHERFFMAYDEAWPAEPGRERRQAIYQLYHLLNHLNHFGGGYAGGVARALARAVPG